MLSSVALLFSACSDTDELVEATPSIPWPSTTYINAPVITSVVPGYNTAEVNWTVLDDENITRTAIYYNDNADTVVLDLTSTTMYYKIEGINEGTQFVVLRNFGATDDVYSTTDRESADVYGDDYLASYGDGRPIADMSFAAGVLTITWGDSEDYTAGTLTYTNSSDEETTVAVAADDATTVLDDAVSYGNFSYTSDYMPAGGCDPFTVTSTDMMFPANSTLDAPTGVVAQAGYKRAVVTWTVPALEDAEVVVFWGTSAAESYTTGAVAGSTMSYEIPNLPDGDYTISVYMKKGTEVSSAESSEASVYGGEYFASLGSGREIESVIFNDRGATVLWSKWPSGCESVDFYYKDGSGSTSLVTLYSTSDISLVLADAVVGKEYWYVTNYRPEGGLDVISIDSESGMEFPSYVLISPENVEVYPGDLKALVMWDDPEFYADGTEITISWGDKSVTLPATGNSVPDYEEYYTHENFGVKASYSADNAYLIEDIEAGTHIITMSTAAETDDYGYSTSNTVSDIVVVYDNATYAVSLTALPVNFLSYTDGSGASVTFEANSTSGNTYVYTFENEEDAVQITNSNYSSLTLKETIFTQPETESAVTLADAIPNTDFYYVTEYYPSAVALDKVISPAVIKTVPGPLASYSYYTPLELPGDMDDLDGGSYPKTKLCDNNMTGSFFHSGSVDNSNQTITIDLGQMIHLSNVKLWPRGSYVLRHNDCKNFRLYGAAVLTEDMYTASESQETESLNGMAVTPSFDGWIQLLDNVSSDFFDFDTGIYYNFMPSGSTTALSSNDSSDPDQSFRSTYGLEVDIDVHSYDAIRYLRIQMIDNWGGTTSFAVGEVQAYGVVTVANGDLEEDAYDIYLQSDEYLASLETDE